MLWSANLPTLLCASGKKGSRCCGSRTKKGAPPSGSVTFVPGYGRMCVGRSTRLHRHAAAAKSTAAPQSSSDVVRDAVDAGASAALCLHMPRHAETVQRRVGNCARNQTSAYL